MRNQDPMLSKLHSTIRSLRQAQRHAIQHWRTFEQAQEALDQMACDGLIKATERHRVVLKANGFTVEPRHAALEPRHVETVHN